MTRGLLADVSIEGPDEFETVLAVAVEIAVEANVDVRGAWEFRSRGSTNDWEVETVELVRNLDVEE